mmetsp:Transcript_25763/g.25580  ORF Transcript_25763/g.25580 Transcript_25763/m.25580 type:complete len:87 (-) Transcript_25763:7-267(-)
MISEADKARSDIGIIEEAKSESEEDYSHTHKLSNLESSIDPSSFSDSQSHIAAELFKKGSEVKAKNHRNKKIPRNSKKSLSLSDFE